MKNFVHKGDTLTLTAPDGGVVGGVPIIVGALLVIPIGSAPVGSPFVAVFRGVYNLPKVPSESAGQLDKVYYDEANKVFTTDSEGNRLAGVFDVPALAGSEIAEINLTAEVI
jgi:predicted RecA/RadA family phage recombinase